MGNRFNFEVMSSMDHTISDFARDFSPREGIYTYIIACDQLEKC